MKVIIAGSRQLLGLDAVQRLRDGLADERRVTEFVRLHAYFWVRRAIDQWVAVHGMPTLVISGGATGVDWAGECWATAVGLPVQRMPANWLAYGPSAGPRRNVQMAELADGLIAVWDGSSRGTAHMVRTMQGLKKPVHLLAVDPTVLPKWPHHP